MIAFLAQWLGESYSYQMGLSVIAFLETLSGVAVFIFPLKHKPQYVVRAAAGLALMAAIMIIRAILRTHLGQSRTKKEQPKGRKRGIIKR